MVVRGTSDSITLHTKPNTRSENDSSRRKRKTININNERSRRIYEHGNHGNKGSKAMKNSRDTLKDEHARHRAIFQARRIASLS